MTPAERKIEAALDAVFRDEGWLLDTVSGDHVATHGVEDDDESTLGSVTINLTSCAKRIAEDL